LWLSSLLNKLTIFPSVLLLHKIKAKLICLFLFLIFSLTLIAGEPSIRFQHFTVDDGLPQNTVYTMLQDSTGFLWFGTQEGLVRYDGYSFKTFKHDPNNIRSISDSLIYEIIEDPHGNLWIGTRKGLNVFNPRTELFTRYLHQESDLTSLSDDIISSILVDSKENIWIGTVAGLNLFNPITKNFTRFYYDKNEHSSISDDFVTDIIEGNQGSLWIGTNRGGLNHFKPNTGRFTHYRHKIDDTNSISSDNVRSVMKDRKGNLWIGTSRAGLNHFNLKTKQFTRYIHQTDDPTSLSHRSVRDIMEDSQGDIWIGTDSGINLFNPQTKEFTHYSHQSNNFNSLSNDLVWSMMEDKQGNLWFGTNSGLNRFHPRSRQFSYYHHQKNEPNSLSNDVVWSLMVDNEKNLWVGTHGGGLNHYNPISHQFTHYRHQPNVPNSLSHDIVSSIINEGQGKLWVGTAGGGLNHYSPISNQFTHYRHQPNNPNSLSNDSVSMIIKDSQNNLWIGTNLGLNHFNSRTKLFTRYINQAGNVNSLSSNTISDIVESSKGNLWIGTYGGGLNHFNPSTKQFTHYRYQKDDPDTISHDSIYSVLEDSQGNVWVGTAYGLNLFDAKTQSFRRYMSGQGLPNNVINSIEEDNSGNLWISTNFGLSRLNPKTGMFKNYDVNDGLQGNEFNSTVSFKSESGELIFGGTSGFNRFNPEKIIDDGKPPKVVLTDMLLLNKSVPIVPIDNPNNKTETLKTSSPIKDVGFSLAQVIHETNEVTLTYEDNSIAFEFAVLHFSNTKKNQFAYQLVGWDKDWVNTDYKNRRATYTNLPDGNYTFKVKASNADGYWNEEGTSIQIIILPPLWRTWWAYTIYAIILIGLIWLFIRINLTTERAKMMGELVEKKNQLLADVSHELRTPLTVLQLKVEALQCKLVEDVDASYEGLLIKIGDINNMISDIYQLSQSDIGAVQFELSSEKCLDIVTIWAEEMAEVVRLKGFKWQQQINVPESLLVTLDKEKIKQVVSNLIDNSVTYTDSPGVISMSTRIVENQLEILIEDSAPGVPKSEYPKIFERLYRVEKSRSRATGGSGLGLSICKSIIRTHKGTIIAMPSKHGGLAISIKLPVIKE